MIDEGQRTLTKTIEEKTFDVHKLTNTQLGKINQPMVANQELNRKDIKISNLKFELISEKEVIERMNKPSEVVKYFEDLMRSPRGMNNTTRLGYNSTMDK